MNPKDATDKIGNFMRAQLRETKTKGVVIGLSGGLDSSVVAELCVRSLGKDSVYCLLMPTKYTDKKDIDDAKELSEKLGIKYAIIDIEPILKTFLTRLPKSDKKKEGNLAPRVRASILYYYANTMDFLVVGAGNKSEISIGYFTKYGDGACDLLPLGDLYKTDVIELAKYLGLPQKIVNKAPTAGLWSGQTDEGEIGMAYTKLDAELKKIENGEKADSKVMIMVKRSEHKRRMPPICKI